VRYAYVSDAGEVHWVDKPIGEEPPAVFVVVGKVTFKRSYRAERAGVPPTSGWPMTCVASGVNAEDAQKLRDEFTRCGVPTEVTSDGDPIYRDAGHRKKALRARGFVDKLSFY
jgi:hypothetical protein